MGIGLTPLGRRGEFGRTKVWVRARERERERLSDGEGRGDREMGNSGEVTRSARMMGGGDGRRGCG